MNTMRRVISKTYPCRNSRNKFQEDELVFEGERGEFHMSISHYNPFEGTHHASIILNKDEAETLYKSLSIFLK